MNSLKLSLELGGMWDDEAARQADARRDSSEVFVAMLTAASAS